MKNAFAIGLLVFSATAMADPLAEFQAIVKQCKLSYDAVRPRTEVSQSARDKAWFKQVWGPATIAYDVRKSDSLVSPFTAYIEITEVFDGDSAPTQEAAAALTIDIDGRATRYTERLRFAYQEGIWQLVDGIGTDANRSTKGQSFRTEAVSPHSRDSLMKRPAAAPVSACLGLAK